MRSGVEERTGEIELTRFLHSPRALFFYFRSTSALEETATRLFSLSERRRVSRVPLQIIGWHRRAHASKSCVPLRMFIPNPLKIRNHFSVVIQRSKQTQCSVKAHNVKI